MPSVDRNLKTGFILSLLLLLAIVAASFFSIRALYRSSDLVDHSNLVIATLEKSMSIMKDAETGQRGYLLTGDESFLGPYNGSYDKALAAVNDFSRLTMDNPRQKANAQKISAIVTNKLTILKDLIDKKRSGQIVTSSDLNAGKVAMDEMRSAVTDAERNERALLATRLASVNRYTVSTPIFLVLAALAAIFISTLAFFRVNSGIKERARLYADLQTKERETADSNDELATLNEELTASNEELLATQEQVNDLNEQLAASNEELTASNEELMATNEDLFSAREDLSNLNGQLEERITERTADLQEREGELATLNEELTAANEELISINEELHENQEHLQKLVGQLEESEQRSRDIVAGAPFPIGVYTGREMRITLANQSIIDVWGKGNDVIGKTYHNLLPELVDQEIYGQLDDVFVNGEPFHARNQRVDIVVDDVLQPFYFNYSFTPLRDSKGNVYGVMNTAAEVTDIVKAKQQVEASEAELKEIKKQLEDELEVSKQLQRQKDDFIGMASHELKTPLTSLSAMIQVAHAKLKNSDDPFLAQAMNKASVQVKRMTAMINGFLNVSRLEAGKIIIEKERFDLDGLVNEVLEETKLMSSGHQLSFESCGIVEVLADRDKIGSVLSNLVGNAIKYSPKGKLVDVGCDVKGNEVVISVKDQGMGIKPEDIKHIFDRYYRVQSSHTQHIAGFGIGLYLSAEIIRQHDGRVWVESESGVGSTFYFSLSL